MMTDALPAERTLLSDSVLQQLTGQIVRQALMPGDTLPSETELGRQFGVSKPVVREALRKLAALGIVDIRHGKPSTVGNLAPEPVRRMFQFALHINPRGLEEAIELRRALETHAAVLAASRIEDDEVTRLNGLVAAMEASIGNLDRWVAADYEFHQALANYSGNSLVAFLIAALGDTIREVISALHSQTEVRDNTATVKRHHMIVAALAARDPAKAEAAMSDHFNATRPAIVALTAEAAARRAANDSTRR